MTFEQFKKSGASVNDWNWLNSLIFCLDWCLFFGVACNCCWPSHSSSAPSVNLLMEWIHPQVAEKCKQVEEVSTWGCMLCHRGWGLRAIKPSGCDTEADGTLFGFASQGSCDMFFCRIRMMMNTILIRWHHSARTPRRWLRSLVCKRRFFSPKTLRPLNAMIHSTLNQSQVVYTSITGASLWQKF